MRLLNNLRMRVGIGYDVHPLAPDRRLILGGVELPFSLGLSGHSDADVVVHAVMDALLGAAALGDIGTHFPPDDPHYEGISSIELLARVGALLTQEGWEVGNVDAVVVAERPRLSPFFTDMCHNISRALSVGPNQVAVKATTSEGLGFAGRGEGIAAWAVVLLLRPPEEKRVE